MIAPAPALVVEEVKESAKPQAAEVAWYVRPPGGGQFGPAAAADFAQWIGEGRVVAEAYVWQTGWTDWRRAGEAAAELPATISATVLPLAVSPATVPSAEPIVKPVPLTAPARKQSSPPKRPPPRRRRSTQRQLLLAAALLTVTLILGGVLLWVLSTGAGS